MSEGDLMPLGEDVGERSIREVMFCWDPDRCLASLETLPKNGGSHGLPMAMGACDAWVQGLPDADLPAYVAAYALRVILDGMPVKVVHETLLGVREYRLALKLLESNPFL